MAKARKDTSVARKTHAQVVLPQALSMKLVVVSTGMTLYLFSLNPSLIGVFKEQ